MKILQVMAGAKHGGAETAFVDTCIAFHEAGENIEVVTRSNDVRIPPLKEAGIKIHTLPMGGKIDVYSHWRIRKIIKDFQPDIIQTWLSRGAYFTPAWKKSMGIPRYLVVPRLGGYYKAKYYKSADYFTCITPDLCRHIEKTMNVPKSKLRQINNFAETEKVVKPLKRAAFHTPEEAPLLIAMGRLHESKAFDVLIRAVAEIPGLYLWIAGEGPKRESLEDLIKKLKLGDRVKLLGWRDDRAALLQAADICVFPSRYEPFGTVFLQAWAQKTPLITSNSNGPRQFVRDGEDGLIFSIDDQESLKQALLKLTEDKNLQKTLVENGYKRYRNEFTKEKTLQAYLSYFHEIRALEGL